MVAVFINGESVDIQLEHEKTLNDLVSSMERWLGERDLICTALEVDGRHIDPADRLFLMQRPVHSVEKINLITAPLSLIEGENSVEIMHYLARFDASLRSESDEIYSTEAREGLRWVVGSLRLLAGLRHFNLDSFPSEGGAISKILSVFEQAVADLEAAPGDANIRAHYREVLFANIEVFIKQAYEFLVMLNKSIAIEEDFTVRIEELQRAFLNHTEQVGNISADLQTGNEARAISLIQQTVFLLEEFVRLVDVMERRSLIHVKNIQSGEEFMADWLGKITQTGQGVIAAFHEKDIILLGDLFEYEIKEELTKAPGFLDELKKKIGTDG
jgi:hypothetical protein